MINNNKNDKRWRKLTEINFVKYIEKSVKVQAFTIS